MAALAKRIADFTKARPGLYKIMRPMADRYMDLAGYRQIGLVYDDIIHEESDIVHKALKRLPPRLMYDRMYRQRRAMQCSLSHTVLPREEWTKPEEDIHYLQPYIEEVESEIKERKELDSLVKARY